MRISKGASDSPEVKRLREVLGLAPGKPLYRLPTDIVGADPDNLGVAARSLLGVLFYLSQSVEVPFGDELAGKVTATKDERGMPFEWSRVTGPVMRVGWSRLRPSRHAAVAVPYRGVWFYIDDADLNSKSTFSLLSQLFMLQAGSVKMQAPLLTLPVGG